jgi:transcriptional regulator with XRE-family HTH domain
MTHLKNSEVLKGKIRQLGYTYGSLAKRLNLRKSMISNFIHGNRSKVGKRNYKLIRKAFIELGIIPTPKTRPRCACPICGKVHVRGKHVTSIETTLTTEKDSITENNFQPISNSVQKVIMWSRREARLHGNDYIGTEHLLLGIIQFLPCHAVEILIRLNVDILKLKKAVEDTVNISDGTLKPGNLPLTIKAEKVLKIMCLEAELCKSDTIYTEHLLLSILHDNENTASQILNGFNISYDAVDKQITLSANNNQSKTSANNLSSVEQ